MSVLKALPIAARVRTAAIGAIAAGLVFPVHAQEAPGAPRGSDIFDSACAHCHGTDGRGTALAPSLLLRVADTEDDEALAAFLRAGVPQRGMPPAPVTGDEMTSLVAYLRFLGSAAGAAEVAAAREQGGGARSTIDSFRPVTEETLQAPADADWLWFGRSRDGRSYTPLDQLNAGNVRELRLVWSRGLPAGSLKAQPIVYSGVMYVAMPDSSIAALDAATGDVFWQSSLDGGADGDEAASRSGTLSIFGDTLFFTPTVGPAAALDARTGEGRASGESPAPGNSAPDTVAEGDTPRAGSDSLATGGGLIFSGQSDRRYRAQDAETGEVLWETILGGPVSTGGLSYLVDGRQHVAVVVDGAGGAEAAAGAGSAAGAGAAAGAAESAAGGGAVTGDAEPSPGALYVFALPGAGEQDDR